MYKIKKLANGLRLITAPIKGTDTVTVLIMVGTGSKYENRKNNGISHFLEHMFFKGTKKRPTALAISSELDNLGGVYNAFTGKEYTGYFAKVAASKIETAVEIVSDMFLNSRIDPEEIEREKGVIVEEINMYMDNPIMRIEDVFEKCLYGDQPAGWDTAGQKKNVLSFKQKDFTDYLSSQYGSKSSVICLAGNIEEKKATKIVEKYFLGLKKSEFKNKLKVKENQKKPTILIEKKATDQIHLSLGVRTFSHNHKDRFIAKMLSVILGGSMSSRLFINLRERNGLAYYVRTSTEFYTDTGYLTTQAGVPKGKLEKAIKIILDEYKKIKEELVPEEELKRVKDMIKGKAIISLEASDNVANWYARQSILDEEIETPRKYLEKISLVKSGDIKRVAGDVFKNQKLNLAVIGPIENSKKIENLFTF